MGCSDGSTRQIAGGTTGSRQKIKLSRSGRFEFGAQLGMRAEFADCGPGQRQPGDRRAAGAGARERAERARPERRAIACDSEIVEWTARRR